MATFKSYAIQEGKSCKDIYLKFTHNNLHSQGNHYDSIVNGQQPHTNNLELLSEVAVNEVVKHQRNHTMVSKPDIPTGDDYEEVITLCEDEDYFDIIPPLKKKTTSPQMQSSSQQNCTLPEVLTLQDEPESPSQINTPQKTAKDHFDVPRIGKRKLFSYTNV